MTEENGEVEALDYDRKYAVGEYDPVAKMVKPKPPNLQGGERSSPDWQRYIAARSKAKRDLRTELKQVSGATKAEIEAQMLEQLVPKALKVLRSQLASPDERVQQSAAVKVLEYARGKPVQKLQAEMVGVQKIVYESAAWQPEAAVLEATALEVLTLPVDDAEDSPQA